MSIVKESPQRIVECIEKGKKRFRLVDGGPFQKAIRPGKVSDHVVGENLVAYFAIPGVVDFPILFDLFAKRFEIVLRRLKRIANVTIGIVSRKTRRSLPCRQSLPCKDSTSRSCGLHQTSKIVGRVPKQKSFPAQ